MGLKGPRRKVLEVAAALIAREGKVLLARRRPGDEQGGLWEFPGGGLEEGEDIRGCLVRELREELGVEVEVGEEVAEVTHDYGDSVVHLHLFAAEIRQGEPLPLGCAEVRWVPWGEVGRLPLAAADKRLVEKLTARGLPIHPAPRLRGHRARLSPGGTSPR